MALKNIPLFKKLKGFTLTEILIAVLILGIVGGSALTLGHTYIKHFEQANEITIAKDRATMVLTFLEKRVLHAGLGMPSQSGEFEAAFEGLWEHQDFKSFHDPEDRRWHRPVQKPEPPLFSEPFSESEVLLVAYAVPSGAHANRAGKITSSGVDVEISDKSADTEADEGKTAKGWVVFSSGEWPFKVKELDNHSNPKRIELSMNGQGDRPVRENDQLHYVRFMEARAEGGSFKTRDLAISKMKSGLQPIIEGILDCRFRLDKNGLLAVSVLARGNKKYSDFVTPADVPHWGTVEDDEWRKYHLVALTRGWRVRNWRPE